MDWHQQNRMGQNDGLYNLGEYFTMKTAGGGPFQHEILRLRQKNIPTIPWEESDFRLSLHAPHELLLGGHLPLTLDLAE